MTDPVSVLVVALGGYGEVYLSALLDEDTGGRCTIVGAVDPSPSGAPVWGISRPGAFPSSPPWSTSTGRVQRSWP